MTTTTDSRASAFFDNAAVRPRADLLLVRLRGDDQRSWLNGQVTNDVRHTTAGQGVYGLAVNVRGKIMGDVWVLDRSGELAVLLPRTAAQAVLESFENQIIMEDVELEPDEKACVISVQGPRAGEVVAELPQDLCFVCDELGSGGRFVLVGGAQYEPTLQALAEHAAALGGGMAEEADFELARLRAGRPRFGTDFGEKNYPQEAGLHARAVSFNKGCYLGQEVVCTLENRGRLSRRLARLELKGGAVEPGDELRNEEGKVVGALTSCAHDPERQQTLALGYVKSASATAGSQLATQNAQLQVTGLVGSE